LKSEIIQDPSKISESYPEYKLQVIYKVITRSHDGYCSDHIYAPAEDEEVREEVVTKEKYFPLPRFLIESDFDKDGNMLSKGRRNLYKKQPKHQVIGWCEDCQTKYKIISVKLIRPSPESRLPEKRNNWRAGSRTGYMDH
jgi:hypothetical protein